MSKHELSSRHFQRKILQFCELRIAPIASKRALENIKPYLNKLIVHRQLPPLLNGRIDWLEIAHACEIGGELTGDLKKQLRIALDAIHRWLGPAPVAEDLRRTKRTSQSNKPDRRKSTAIAPSARKPPRIDRDNHHAQAASTQRGPQPKPIQPFPEPLFEASEDPAGFQDALVYQMRRFGESYWHLYRAIIRLGETFNHATLLSWIQGERVPRSVASFAILSRIERRYQLPEGYFKGKLPHQGSCPRTWCSFGARRAFRTEPGMDQLAAGRLMRGSSLIVAMVSRVM